MGRIPTLEEVVDLFQVITGGPDELKFRRNLIAKVGKDHASDIHSILKNLIAAKYDDRGSRYEESLIGFQNEITPDNLIITGNELNKVVPINAARQGYAGPQANQFGKGGRRKTRRSSTHRKRKTRGRRHERRH